jgi:hypothetical protein
MFGKLVKYVVAKGMKILPNFIGRTSATAQSDVVSEGFIVGNVTESLSGDAGQQPYTGQVVDQNPSAATIANYETPVDLTIRTFSFAPFGVFGFSPFAVFSFAPFSVFSFTPFSVFSFTPFSVFSFTPFKVFGFSPFGFSPFKVFGFSPAVPVCIDQDTPVLTKNGYVLAKDIAVGDTLITKTFKDIPITNHDGLREWSSENNKEYTILESTVNSIKESEVSATVVINGDKYKRFSTQEDILVVRDGKLMFVISSELKNKDLVVKNADENIEDGLLYEVRSIEIIQEVRKVYDFTREPFGLIVADSLLVYNSYPVD